MVQAARVSYGRGTRRVSDDRGLIRYLMRHRHTTPFEMCEIKLHVKLPIFVARQWIRHRTASVNEYSARYSILDREFYIPASDVIAAQSLSNRQGRGDQLPASEAARVQDLLREDAHRAHEHYEELLNEESEGKVHDPSRIGLARELARINLSLNYYTQWYWKIDLHNLLNFLSLRADSHAQYEIRVYAEAILEKIVQSWVPLTYEAFATISSTPNGSQIKSWRLFAPLLRGGAMRPRHLGVVQESLRESGANSSNFWIWTDESTSLASASCILAT